MIDYFIEQIPYSWLALGMLLALGEILIAGAFFLLGPAIGAFLVGLILFVFPSIPFDSQLILFGILSIILTFFGRYYFLNNQNKQTQGDTINALSKNSVGRIGKVVVVKNNIEGMIALGHTHWQAKWGQAFNQEKPQMGDDVIVEAVDGMRLIVAPIDKKHA